MHKIIRKHTQKALWNPKGLQLVRDTTTDYSNVKSTDGFLYGVGTTLFHDPFVVSEDTDSGKSKLWYEPILTITAALGDREIMPPDSGFWGNTYLFCREVHNKIVFAVLVTTNEITTVTALDDSSVVLSYALSKSLERNLDFFLKDLEHIQSYSEKDIYNLDKTLQGVCKTAYEELFVFLENNSFQEKYKRSISDALSSLDVSIFSVFKSDFENLKDYLFVCMHTLGRAVTNKSPQSVGGKKDIADVPAFHDTYRSEAFFEPVTDSFRTHGPISFESFGSKEYDEELFGDRKMQLSVLEDLHLSFWQRMECVEIVGRSKPWSTASLFLGRMSLSRGFPEDPAVKSNYYTKMRFNIRIEAQLETVTIFTAEDINPDFLQAVLDCFTPADKRFLENSSYLKFAKLSPDNPSANKDFSWERFIATIEKFKSDFESPPVTQEAIDKALGLLFEFNKHSIMRSFCDTYNNKYRDREKLNKILFWYNKEYNLDSGTLARIFSTEKMHSFRNVPKRYFYAPFFLAELYLAFLAILQYWNRHAPGNLNSYTLPVLKPRENLIRPMDHVKVRSDILHTGDDFETFEKAIKDLLNDMIFKPVDTFLDTRKKLYLDTWNADMRSLNYDLFASSGNNKQPGLITQPEKQKEVKVEPKQQQSSTTPKTTFSAKQQAALDWWEANKGTLEDFPEISFELAEGIFEAAFLMYHENIVDKIISENDCLAAISGIRDNISQIVKDHLDEYVTLAGIAVYRKVEKNPDNRKWSNDRIMASISEPVSQGMDFTFETLTARSWWQIVPLLVLMLTNSPHLEKIMKSPQVVVCRAEKYWADLNKLAYPTLVNFFLSSPSDVEFFAKTMGMLFFTAYYNAASSNIAAAIRKAFKQYKPLPDKQLIDAVITAKQTVDNFKNSILHAYGKLNPPNNIRVDSKGKRIEIPAKYLIEQHEMKKMIDSAMAKGKLSASENEWFLKKDVLGAAFFDLLEKLDLLLPAASTTEQSATETPKVEAKVEAVKTPKVEAKVEAVKTPKVEAKVEAVETSKVDTKELKEDLKKLLLALKLDGADPTDDFVDFATNSTTFSDYAAGSEVEPYKDGSNKGFAAFVTKFCTFLNVSGIGSGKALPKGTFYVDEDLKNRVYSGAKTFALDLYPNLILCLLLNEDELVTKASGVKAEGRLKYGEILEKPGILVDAFKELNRD